MTTEWTLELQIRLDAMPDRMQIRAEAPTLEYTEGDGWRVYDGDSVIAVVLGDNYTSAHIRPRCPSGAHGPAMTTPASFIYRDSAGTVRRTVLDENKILTINPEGYRVCNLGTLPDISSQSNEWVGKAWSEASITINNPKSEPIADQIADAHELDVLMGACGVDRQRAAIKSLLADVKSLNEPEWLDEDTLDEHPAGTLAIPTGAVPNTWPRRKGDDGLWYANWHNDTVGLQSIEIAPACVIWKPEYSKGEK